MNHKQNRYVVGAVAWYGLSVQRYYKGDEVRSWLMCSATAFHDITRFAHLFKGVVSREQFTDHRMSELFKIKMEGQGEPQD